MVVSSRICLFADEVAVVLRDLHVQLGAVLAQMEKATGFSVNMRNCVVAAL